MARNGPFCRRLPMRDTGSGASEQTPFWAALRPCTRTHPLCLAAEALRYASEGFRNNRDLVIEAVQENTEALLYAADSFKTTATWSKMP